MGGQVAGDFTMAMVQTATPPAKHSFASFFFPFTEAGFKKGYSKAISPEFSRFLQLPTKQKPNEAGAWRLVRPGAKQADPLSEEAKEILVRFHEVIRLWDCQTSLLLAVFSWLHVC